MKIKNIANSLVLLTMLTSSSFALGYENKSIKIEVNSPLSTEEKNRLYSEGVGEIVYAGDMSYYLYGNSESLDNIAKNYSIIQNSTFDLSKDRLDDEIFMKKSNLTGLSVNDPVHLNVLFLKAMSIDEIKEYISNAGVNAEVYSVTPSLQSAKLRISPAQVDILKELPLIQYIDRANEIGIRNTKTANYSNVENVWSGPYNLTGHGMSVAIVDGGMVRKTHQEFQGRVYDMNSDVDYADHATHVAGSIGASGVDERARGMASDATIYSYSFVDMAFADMSVKIYNSNDILFSNHSYGYSDKSKLATYDSEAAKQDRAVAQNPFLNIFEAAGNDGEDESYPDFGKIKGPGNSKNILTIGALNLNVSGKAVFSSNGPVSDGRIKPDLCVRGEGIYSTGSQYDGDYLWMSGTSMATPAATGMGLLVAEAYKKVSGGYDIRHDILKSALINGAVDKGRVGPDYDLGYGMIDLQATVDIVNSLASSSPLLYVDKLTNNQQKELSFSLKNTSKFKATISWVDPAGNPSSKSSLVNDLDMVLISKSGKTYYPYTLNPSEPMAVAKQDRANHIDNIEQIEVSNLPAGEYQLVIKGSTVITQFQEFAIASNISISTNSNIGTLEPSKLKNFAKVIQASIL